MKTANGTHWCGFTYDELTETVQRLQFTSMKEYAEFVSSHKTPHGDLLLPVRLDKSNGFKGWPAYLGYGESKRHIMGSNFLSFEEARRLMGELRIGTQPQFKKLLASPQRPTNIPSNPEKYYTGEWLGWPHFVKFGRELAAPNEAQKRRAKYLKFEAAREVARSAQLQTSDDYAHRRSKTPGLPPQPQTFYQNEWQGWGDFLGLLKLEEAMELLKPLRLNSKVDFLIWHEANKPRIPRGAPEHYDRWPGWDAFLGHAAVKTARPSEKKLSFEDLQPIEPLIFNEARNVARSMNLRNAKEYSLRYTEVAGLPPHPKKSYSEEWQGWHDFLGIKSKVIPYVPKGRK